MDFIWSLKNLPSLPIVVVLPTPFTPDTTITVGLQEFKESKSLWYGINVSETLVIKILIIWLESVKFLSIFKSSNSFFNSATISTPTSALIRSSSNWDKIESSIFLLEKMSLIPFEKFNELKLRPVLNLSS